MAMAGLRLERIQEAEEVFNAIKDTQKIPEIDAVPRKRFKVSSVEEVLYPLIEQNQVIVVAGGFFGDEAKGKVTHAILGSGLVKLTARTNSGENAGHTVVHDGIEYKFNLTPSGVLTPGVTALIGPECVMDPISFMQKEVSQLVRAGQQYKEKLFVGNVQIVTPYHKLMDLVASAKNASTLQGMSPVHQSKVGKRGLRLDDLFGDEKKARDILAKDMESYYALLTQKKRTQEDVLQECLEINEETPGKIQRHVLEFLKTDKEHQIDYLMNLYREQVVANKDFPTRKNTTKIMREHLKAGGKLLIEGPQSYWLSNAVENHARSSTSANTTAAGILAAANINPSYSTLVLNVHKTPASSRVGIGANPAAYAPQDFFSRNGVNKAQQLTGRCIDFDAIQQQYFASIRENGILEPTVFVDKDGTKYLIGEAMAVTSVEEYGEIGVTSGKPRMPTLFDLVALAPVIEAQGPYLSISAIDRGDVCDNIGVVVGYVYHHAEGKESDSNGHIYRNGDIIRIGDEYPNENVLYHCRPIIRKLPGWKDSPMAADKWDRTKPLPEGVQLLFGLTEELTGATILSFGNGKNPENLVYVDHIEA